MRNLMMKAILFFLLALIPSHFTSSSIVPRENEMLDIEKLSRFVYKQELVDKINSEYSKFYENLYTYDGNTSKRRHDKNIAFIDRISCHALDGEALPSIAIAQAILETGYGRHNKLKNNIFGIKGRGIKSRTKEFVNGRYITIRSEFQYFRTLDDAFDRHFDIIGRYGFDDRDYKTWAFRIKKCGYATDPKYAYKLVHIIEKHDLARLDKIQELSRELDSLNYISENVGLSEV